MPNYFSICEDYTNIVWCNVLSMDSIDILLGRPWMYDKNGTNGMRNNTYTFMHGKKKITLRPIKPAPPKKGSKFSYRQGSASSAQCLLKQHQEKQSLRSNSFPT